MNREGLVTLGVVVCCVLAIGSAASAMEAAVETTPDDAIDVGYRSIPLDGDTVDRMKARLQPGDGAQRSPQAADGPGAFEAERVKPGSGGVGQLGRQESAGPSAGGSGGGAGGGAGLADRLLDLLRALLAALLGLLALLVPLAVLALAVRYRDRWLGLLRRLLAVGRSAGPAGDDVPARSRPLPPARPRDDVARDWYEMVRRLGLADRRSVTPGECAAAAARAGVDPAPVGRLNALFERVRYGGAPVTDRRRDRSGAALREIVEQLADGGRR